MGKAAAFDSHRHSDRAASRVVVIGRDHSQRFLDGEVHNWYRIMLGYSDHLVAKLLDDLEVKPGHRVLDPFCGTGTTLVECMKRGVQSIGIDANPASVFAARVKTNWDLTAVGLLAALETTTKNLNKYLRRRALYKDDPTYDYIVSSGMLSRGWIGAEPLRTAIALKTCIKDIFPIGRRYRNPLLLALTSTVVRDASNVRFGPELYCGPPRKNVDVVGSFAARVKTMANDVELLDPPHVFARVLQGDSRAINGISRLRDLAPFDFVICSPPYPTEHDYTRNGRLELALLEHVTDLESLRACKRQMVRSHTKGIYKEDRDREFVKDDPRVQQITTILSEKIKGKPHGFARLYPTVIAEYFGGMKRHLKTLWPVIRPGARCAFVLGEQASYANVHVPTADILGSIAEECGYRARVGQLRTRCSTTTDTELREQILFLTKPADEPPV